VKLWDGTTVVDVFTNTDIVDNLDTLKGLVTTSVCHGYLSAAETRPLQLRTATSDIVPNLDTIYLLATHALLSARKDAATTIGLSALDGTVNALYIAITDGSRSLDMIAMGDALATYPYGLGSFGYNLQAATWQPLPITYYTNTIANIATWTVPTINVTTERVEGTKVTDGTTPLAIDAHADAAIVIPHSHHELYEGNHFTASYRFLAVADDGYADLRIYVHADYFAEMSFAVETEAKVYIDLYEGTTYTVDGTAVVRYNNNRTSGTAANALVYHTPTIDAAGTVIRTALVGSAGRFTEGGGEVESANIRLLQKATDYLIRVQNKGGNAKDIVIRFKFHEST